ncbi:MAG: hypothetical protein COA81_11045 [Alphaproteobacteria bacterium]|nr:MAG: hypothetical protein COA81_11045 [Alphaproteobacteria bacterium]
MLGNVVIFAGSGISTENPSVLPNSFYQDICAKIGEENSGLPFPQVMEKFANQHNGRLNLLTAIKERFQVIDSFPELRNNATRFHRELATFYPVDTIVTTNWDRYFEEECGASAFISPEDLAFWDAPGRKVLKIHGSIDNYGSIVATQKDYDTCEKDLREGVIGSILKVLLATKTIVYIGYSLNDDDFRTINSFVRDEMKGLHRQAYIVTPFKNDEHYENHGVIPIYTDGTYFIRRVKEHAKTELEGHFLSDTIYDAAAYMLRKVYRAHDELHKTYNGQDNPEVIICAFYQDGLCHGLERVLAMKKTGHYSHSCAVGQKIAIYENYRQKYLKHKIYEHVAYIDGYINALKFVASNANVNLVDCFPLFYAFGAKYDLVTFDDYAAIDGNIPSMHKAAYKRAKQIASKDDNDMVMHHPPWL